MSEFEVKELLARRDISERDKIAIQVVWRHAYANGLWREPTESEMEIGRKYGIV